MWEDYCAFNRALQLLLEPFHVPEAVAFAFAVQPLEPATQGEKGFERLAEFPSLILWRDREEYRVVLLSPWRFACHSWSSLVTGSRRSELPPA